MRIKVFYYEKSGRVKDPSITHSIMGTMRSLACIYLASLQLVVLEIG